MKRNSQLGIIFSVKKLSLMACWLIFFLAGCGLDTFYYLNPPISRTFINEAESASQDPNLHYVTFLTATNPDSEDIFQGTVVYYMIYNSPSRLISDQQSIENLSEENSNQGINNLLSWGYQALTTDQIDTVNLIPAGGAREVSIRLFNEGSYQDESGYPYPADVSVDGASIGIPLRSFEDKVFSFNTNAEPDDPDSVPVEGQEDVRFSSGVSTATWYVALYAVSTGTSPSLTPVYSNVTFLGSLAIVPTSN